MKNSLLKFSLLVIALTFLSSCLKSPNHSIRVKNMFSADMVDVRINSTSYGGVEIGATTDYKPVKEGDFLISGENTRGEILNGGGTVSGRGTHKWTLTITPGGYVDFAEDN